MTMATLFGEDPDPRPLWFNKELFMSPDFNSDSYISSLRSLVPLDTLRGELRVHLRIVKKELVELINRDYNDFVNLSTKLVDVDGAVLRMRAPLQELRSKLESVRDSVEASLFALQDALKRRAEATASREVLELLLDTCHVVSKIEKLLNELNGVSEDGSHGHQNQYSIAGDESNENGGEDPQSRLLERIASEMNRLKFYVARVQEMPLIKNMEKRIHSADVLLGENLRRCFEHGLEKRDERVLYHCLRAYAAIDNTAGAEDVFRQKIVAPFVTKVIPANLTRDMAGTEDRLDEPFKEIEKHIEKDCKFLLDIVASENSGLHVFNFLGNSVLKEVVSAIQKGRPGALSPGRPTEFLENYKSSLELLSFVEGFCQSQSALVAFRSQPGYAEFMKLWNLGVYFTLRFQEIASSFDNTLVEGLKRSQKAGFAFESGAKLLESLDRCWHENVYVPALSDKFLKLSLQLISRYTRWLLSGIASRRDGSSENTTWSKLASAEDFLMVRHDVELLAEKISGAYQEHVIATLGLAAEELVRESVLQAARSLLDVGPQMMEVLCDTVTEKCIEELKALRVILTTYRVTLKLPVHHSPYASNLLQPLKAFLQAEPAFMTDASQAEILTMVAKKVTQNYDQQIRDLMEEARKTESSLLRFRQAQRTQQRTAGATDSADPNISKTDRVYAQFFLDVQEYGRQLDALGIKATTLPEYKSLWEFVAPADKQHVISY